MTIRLLTVTGWDSRRPRSIINIVGFVKTGKKKNLRRWEGTIMSGSGDGVSATPTFCVLRISKDFLVLHPWGPNKTPDHPYRSLARFVN